MKHLLALLAVLTACAGTPAAALADTPPDSPQASVVTDDSSWGTLAAVSP